MFLFTVYLSFEFSFLFLAAPWPMEFQARDQIKPQLQFKLKQHQIPNSLYQARN